MSVQDLSVQLHADYHDSWNNPRSLRHPRLMCAPPKHQDKRSDIRPEGNQLGVDGTRADRNPTSVMIRKRSSACSRCLRTGSSADARSDQRTLVCSAVSHCRRCEPHHPRTDVDFPSLAKALRLNNLNFTFSTLLIRISARPHARTYAHTNTQNLSLSCVFV